MPEGRREDTSDDGGLRLVQNAWGRGILQVELETYSGGYKQQKTNAWQYVHCSDHSDHSDQSDHTFNGGYGITNPWGQGSNSNVREDASYKTSTHKKIVVLC